MNAEQAIDYSMMEIYTRHGGAYDRGSADSYYGRPPEPHYFMGGTYNSHQVEEADMTADQINAYWQGYYDNENDRNFKDWGV